MVKVMEHYIFEPPVQVFAEGEFCESCGSELPDDYDAFWCDNCMPSCPHEERNCEDIETGRRWFCEVCGKEFTEDELKDEYYSKVYENV